MKWYKRDPVAFLEGTAELNEQQGWAYTVLIELLYARDGDVSDDLVITRLRWNPRTWRMVKAQLIERKKVWVTDDGKLMAKRVEWTLNEARTWAERQPKRSRIGVENRRPPSKNKGLQTERACAVHNPTTTTTTAIARKEEASIQEIESSSFARTRAEQAISNDSREGQGSMFIDGRPRHGQHDERGRVYVTIDKPEWRAWTEHSRRHGGNGYPNDANFGWWFPSRWPPDHPDVLEAGGQPSKQANGRPT